MALLHFPFFKGQSEAADPKLLPQPYAKAVTNLRLRRDGRWGVRSDYSAVSMTAAGNVGNLFAYDVHKYGLDLVAYGRDAGLTGQTGPNEIYTYQEGLSQYKWRGQLQGNQSEAAFGPVKEVRHLLTTAYGADIQNADLAYTGGFLCLVYEHFPTTSCHAVIFDATTGRIVFQALLSASNTFPRVTAVGNVFCVVTSDLGSNAILRTFDVTSSTAWSAPTTFISGGAFTVGTFNYDLSTMVGSSHFLISYTNSSGAIVGQRYSTAGVQQGATMTVAATTGHSCIIGDTGQAIVLAYLINSSSVYTVRSYNPSTHALTQGPTALYGSATGFAQPSAIFTSATGNFGVAGVSTDTIENRTRYQILTSAHVSVTTFDHREVTITGKLFTSTDFSFHGAPGTVNQGLLTSNTICGVNNTTLAATFDRNVASSKVTRWVSSCPTDGSDNFFCVHGVKDSDGNISASVSSFKAKSGIRTQSFEFNQLLYVGGGMLGIWDARQFVEVGYMDAPIIDSITSSNGAGALTPNSLYTYIAVYEWYDNKGNKHQSSPSLTQTVTMGASDDTNTIVVSTPRSFRRVSNSGLFDSRVRVILYRSEADGLILREVASGFTSANYAETISITDLLSDADSLVNESVYTQGSRGALSGILPHEAPPPSKYMYAGNDRLIIGGLHNPSEVRWSKRIFPGEPIQFSEFQPFLAQISGEVTAVAFFDGIWVIWTLDNIFLVNGDGPEDDGFGGFNSPQRSPSNVGCITWRSLVETSEGIWFQAEADKLFLLPRGSSTPEWEGQAVRDTLELYPVITSATKVLGDHLTVFTANNTEGDDGVIIIRDNRTGEWMVDDVGPIASSCEYQGKLVLCMADGTVRIQSTSLTPATHITTTFETGTHAPFGVNAEGRLSMITFLGEYRGDCVLDCQISYNDGKTFTSIKTFNVSSADYAVGDAVRLEFVPARQKTDRFRLKFIVSSLLGAATEGLVYNAYTLEVQGVDGSPRLDSAKRGN